MTENLVHVMRVWDTGLAEPVFLIRKHVGDDKYIYYVTLALWEYDADKTNNDPNKEAGVAAVAQLYDELDEDQCLSVREFTGSVAPPTGGGDHTNPELP